MRDRVGVLGLSRCQAEEGAHPRPQGAGVTRIPPASGPQRRVRPCLVAIPPLPGPRDPCLQHRVKTSRFRTESRNRPSTDCSRSVDTLIGAVRLRSGRSGNQGPDANANGRFPRTSRRRRNCSESSPSGKGLPCGLRHSSNHRTLRFLGFRAVGKTHLISGNGLRPGETFRVRAMLVFERSLDGFYELRRMPSRPLAVRFAAIPSVSRRLKFQARLIRDPSRDAFSRPRIGKHQGYSAFGVDTVSSEAPTSQAEPWGRWVSWESTWKPAKVIPASIAGEAAAVNRRSPEARSRNQDA